MATLAERLDVLLAQLETLKSANEEKNVVAALRTRQGQVAELRRTLDDALAILTRLEMFGATVSSKPRASAQLRAKPANVVQRLRANPDSVAQDSQWDATVLSPVRAFTDKLDDGSREAWYALVDQKEQPIKDEILDQLERLGMSESVKEVRAARSRIRELRNSLPKGDGVLSEIIALGQAIARVLGALSDLPAGVRACLAKASGQNATFDDLTPEVQAWLREKDMLKLIRIGLR
jgi:hypothetical protein